MISLSIYVADRNRLAPDWYLCDSCVCWIVTGVSSRDGGGLVNLEAVFVCGAFVKLSICDVVSPLLMHVMSCVPPSEGDQQRVFVALEVQFVERLTPQFPRFFVGPLLSWIRYGWLIGTVCSLSFVVCLYHILPAWCDDIRKKQNLKV